MSAPCNKRYPRDSARHFMSLVRRRLLIIVAVLSALILALCLACRPKPPDLTSCTRLEVRYAHGALNYFFPDSSMQKGVLNEEEREHIRSYDRWTVTDHAQIEAFAQQVSQGTYRGWRWSLLALIAETIPPTKIVGYRPRDGRVSFSVYSLHGSSTIRAGGRLFGYDSPHSLSLASLDPPGLERLRARWDCGRRLYHLLFWGLDPGMGRPRLSLDPNHWCDMVVENYRKHFTNAERNSDKQVRMFPDTFIAKVFTCPRTHASSALFDYSSRMREARAPSPPVDTWISDYAMNPNCREDSPKDMVLLFESKPGWNQHGGPELFTFDNHDPKGGLVLLNDGTLKFIRTEEELRQLRWK
jgi:hypothetical protein